MVQETKVLLPESEMPRSWYNVVADLPFELPPMVHPGKGTPIEPDDLAPIFPRALVEQELTRERWVEIPEEVREVYSLWRPSPLYRARRLERALGTPARIYYKWEGVSPPGSHKPNTAVPQAFYNKAEGVKRLATETGAGQWGSALAFACQLFDLACKAYMVRVSYEQKPYRRILMETWGAECVPSPSPDTEAGRRILAEDPDTSGSLGIAISEAVEDAVTHSDTKYSLGSVLNHVLLHQTVIGLEAKRQLEMVGHYPDVLVGCVGGGSNFAGLFLPFIADKVRGSARDLRVLCTEPVACPTLTKGPYAYDFGDTACTTPLLKMFTLGHGFVPPPLHAGGLRYHGMAPIICALLEHGLVEAAAYEQLPVFAAGLQFARTEGFVPAPEPTHAIKAVVDEALRCKEEGKAETIVFSLSGHGHFDLGAYEAYLAGRLTEPGERDEAIQAALAALPDVPG